MNKYIVALQAGGLMESPEIYYTDYQIINADTKTEAVRIYNEINKCDYFYGDVVCTRRSLLGRFIMKGISVAIPTIFEENEWKILDNKITKYNLQSFLNTLKNKKL